jgi:hypothetical protein
VALVNGIKNHEKLIPEGKFTFRKINIFYVLTCLTLFAMTFEGRYIDLGAQITAEKFFSLISLMFSFGYFIGIIKTRAFSELHYKNFILKTIACFLLITLVGNLIFLSEPMNSDALLYFEDRVGTGHLALFRTVLKPVQAFVLVLAQLSWILVPSLALKTNLHVIQAAWVYVCSSTLQAILALIQYLIYLAIGINIFPVYRGGVLDSNLYQQDAVFSMGGRFLIRVNGLSGEPKQLALILSFSIAILAFLLIRSKSRKIKTFAIFCLSLQILSLILTFSTLGFVLFLAGVCTYTLLRKNKVQFLVFMMIIFVTALLFVELPSTVGDIFQERVLERLGFEDFDLVFLEFINSSPLHFFIGCGIGNFHIASFEQAKQVIRDWQFQIFLPYIGVFSLVATSGIFGALTFYLLPYRLIVSLNHRLKVLSFAEKDFYVSVRNLLIYLIIIGFILRLHTLGFIWLGIGFAVLENSHKSLINHQSLNIY